MWSLGTTLTGAWKSIPAGGAPVPRVTLRNVLSAKRYLWRACLALAFFTATSVPVAFAYGPGLPWSPLHPGYQELRLERVRVLSPPGRELPHPYTQLDELLKEAERFHGYSAPRRITVVVAGDWSRFRRLVPWISSHGIGAITMATGTAIYVSPRLDERGLDHGEYLRHELSHAVLAQNTSIPKTLRFNDDECFYEGVAVYFGRQRSYVSQAEFMNRWRRDGVARHLGPGNAESAHVEIRYRYVVWRNFVDYLDHTYGRARLTAFLHAANGDPAAVDTAFDTAFGVTRRQAADTFQMLVASGQFVPGTP